MTIGLEAGPFTCPKCRDIPLKKIQIAESIGQALTCPRCYGLWLSSETVNSRDAVPLIEEDSPDLDPAADGKGGLCPMGHGILIRAKLDADPPFYLDRCVKCGGIWFDRGEWQIASAAGLTQGLPTFWTLANRRARRKEKHRQEYLQMLVENLGQDVFHQVEKLIEALVGHPFRNQAIAFLTEEVDERSRKKRTE